MNIKIPWQSIMSLLLLLGFPLQSLAASPKIQHYAGMMVTSVGGKNSKYLPIVLKRTVDKAQRSVTLEERHLVSKRTYQVTSKQLGSTTKFISKESTLNQVGVTTFKGPAWAWHLWKYQLVQMGNRSRVVLGQGRLISNGKLFIRRDLYTAQGKKISLFYATLTPVTKAAYHRYLRSGKVPPVAPRKPGRAFVFPIKVIALTGSKVGIVGAKIFINKKLIGATDQFGTFVGTYTGRVGEWIAVQVTGRGKGNYMRVRTRLRMRKTSAGRVPAAVKVEAFLRPQMPPMKR